MKKILFPILSFFAFIITCFFALMQKWSLQEFCWIIWLCGLFFSWLCAIFGSIILIFSLREIKEGLGKRFPFLKSFSKEIFYISGIIISLGLGYLFFYIYGFIFSFYGLFLSVFAEMEPLNFFGRNGFINSNFYDPVIFLSKKHYLIILSTIISNFSPFLERDYKKLLLMPFKTLEILRIHIMVILLPFISLFFYIIFKEKYQIPAIFLLSFIFYFLPFKIKKSTGNSKNSHFN